jgi:hypothetical protein
MRFRRATVQTLARCGPASLVIGFSVLLVSPSESLAAAIVRFVHTVPTVGKVTVEVTQAGSERSMGAIGFAQVTPWRSIRSGTFHWALVSGSKTLAHGTATVGDGAYDLVLLARSGVSLGIYRARAGRPGTALVRVIHAAPQLGTPQLRVDSKVAVSSLAFSQATPYLPMSPGVHTLAADPASSTMPLVATKMKVVSGRSYTKIILGSEGQRVRAITLVDRGAPRARAATRGAQTGTLASTAASMTVQPGDSLWTIASAHLGPGADNEAVYRELVAIWKLNALRIGTGTPNLIFPGQRLSFPPTT